MSRAQTDTQAEVSTYLTTSLDDDDQTVFDPRHPWDDDHTAPHSAEELDGLITAAKTDAPVYRPAPTVRPSAASATKGGPRFVLASAGAFVLVLGGAIAIIHSSRHAMVSQPTLPPELALAPSVQPPSSPRPPDPSATASKPSKGPTILHAVIDRSGFLAASIPGQAPISTRPQPPPTTKLRRKRRRHHEPPFAVDANGIPILLP